MTITGRDACRLLTAVLQRIEPEVGQLGDVLARGPDSEDPAGVLRGFLAGKKIVGQSPIAACHMSQSPTARYADGPLRGWPAGRSSRPLVEQDGDETPDQHAKPGTDQPEEAQRGGCVIAGVNRADHAQEEPDEKSCQTASEQERREVGLPADCAGLFLAGLLAHGPNVSAKPRDGVGISVPDLGTVRAVIFASSLRLRAQPDQVNELVHALLRVEARRQQLLVDELLP